MIFLDEMSSGLILSKSDSFIRQPSLFIFSFILHVCALHSSFHDIVKFSILILNRIVFKPTLLSCQMSLIFLLLIILSKLSAMFLPFLMTLSILKHFLSSAFCFLSFLDRALLFKFQTFNAIFHDLVLLLLFFFRKFNLELLETILMNHTRAVKLTETFLELNFFNFSSHHRIIL